MSPRTSTTPAPAEVSLSYPCPKCKRSFRTEGWLTYHTKKDHKKREGEIPAGAGVVSHRRVIMALLRCCQCGQKRTRVVDLDALPTLIECSTCGELVPGSGWRVVMFEGV